MQFVRSRSKISHPPVPILYTWALVLPHGRSVCRIASLSDAAKKCKTKNFCFFREKPKKGTTKPCLGSGPPSLPKAAGIPSPEALVTPVPENEELIREVRYVRRDTTGSSSSSSARSKAIPRGRTAVESPVNLGYPNRLEGQERRGELLRELPNPMEEREDWEESLRAEGLVPSPDEVPTWMGIATQMPRRPAGSREGYGMVGAPKAAADRPLPGEDSETDDEFEFLDFPG